MILQLSENRWKKRGMALVMMMFQVIFVPPHYAMVAISPGDGSVTITTGGIEMGQGLNTKAAQVCAYAFGLTLDMVKVITSFSFTSPGNIATGGSFASDSVCSAILTCCDKLNVRLAPVRENLQNPTWAELIQAANQVPVKLIATHSTSPTDPVPKDYPVYGVATTEVEVDILTGQYQILRSDILQDTGHSLNPLIDIGQIEGAFVMGLGYFSSEEIKFDPATGINLTHRSRPFYAGVLAFRIIKGHNTDYNSFAGMDYLPPGAMDIPIDFRIYLRKNAANPVGVLRSKATGEPSICLSCSLPLALREAIASARKDAGQNPEWIQFNPPCTFEKTYIAAATAPEDFTL